jgi:tetratricopeptide (TPR) repeat protein
MNEKKNLQNRVLKLMNAALSLQRAEEWEQSNTALRKAEVLDPEDPSIQLLLGINYRALEDIEAAEGSLRQALSLDPDYGEALQTLGLLLAEQGRLEESIPLLRACWAQDPGNTQVLEALSSALLQVGEEEDAVRILQRAWNQTREEEPGVLYGRFLIQLGRLEEAEAVLQAVEETYPCPRTLAELALVLLLQDRDAEAADVLEQAIELDPNFDRAWRGLAGCYDRLGKHQRALEVAKQALRLDDEHCRNWLVKTGALLSLERYEDALDAARQGITFVDLEDEETLPVLFQLYEQEMSALLHLGQFDEALERLAENQQQFPDVGRFARMRADLLIMMERYPEALATVEKALEHGVNLLPVKYLLLHVLGRADEAWACLQPELERVAPDVQARRLDALGDTAIKAYMQGEFDAAYTILKQLHEFAPDDPRLLNNLGFMLTGRGELALAKQHLKQITQSSNDEEWQALAALNLAYIYLIQARYAEAEAALDRAQAELAEQPEVRSVARVAYWHAGEIIPEYTPYPFDFYPAQLSIWANEVTLHLIHEEPAKAEALARHIVDAAPKASLGYRVLGWVLWAEEQSEAARETWQQAKDRAPHPTEREALTAWLADLPDTA